MARRIEIELTSARADGTWTWRAAGARQPKGVLDGGVLYTGAKAGDVLRAEADFDVDGITILSVIPPKQKAPEPDRLEVIGSGQDPGPGVITTLVTRGGRRERDDRGRREGGRGEPRGPRIEGRPDRPAGRSAGRPEGAGPRGPRPDGDGGRPERRGPDTGRGPGRDGDASGPRRPDVRTPGRPGADGRPPRQGGRPPREGGRPARAGAGSAPPSRPAPKRLTPGSTHRDAVLETVAPEHLPIAQQVLRGGLPAVRQALAAETEKAKAEGRPPVSTDPILAIAEDLLPRLKTAEWRDRAEAAAAMGDEISIRDLRSVVAGSEAAARDDETRLLASGLREALHRRVEAQRTSWVTDITTAMEESKFMRALRLTGRPPDPGVRLPADLAVKLAEAAGAAMTAELPPERWADLLEAVMGSPVRRSVKPAALPSQAPPELLAAARQAAGQVPALAPLLGLSRPPAPTPVPSRPLTARPPRPQRGQRPVPPPPPSSASMDEPTPDPVAPPAPETPATIASAPPVESAVPSPAPEDPETDQDAPPAMVGPEGDGGAIGTAADPAE